MKGWSEIEEVKGLEANSSLQTKSIRITRVNEENIQIKRKKKLNKFCNSCIFKDKSDNQIAWMFYVDFFIVLIILGWVVIHSF